MAKRQKPVFLPPAQDLRLKAVNLKKGYPLKLEPAELRRLESVIERAADALHKETAEKLRLLRAALNDVAKGDRADQAMRAIRSLSLDIKGMGGMFKYPLLTAFAKSLNDFTNSIDYPTPVQLDIIAAQIDALYVVLAKHLQGSGGRTERALLDALRQATARHKGSRARF
jgi:chemotaxis protein histidine kinase CheA